MLTILLVVQVIIAIAMIIMVLIQHTSTDGLSGLSGGGGGNSLMTGRSSANLLTRTTAILAVAFMANSLAMAVITARQANANKSVVESIEIEANEPQNNEEGGEIEDLSVPLAK